MWNSIDRAVELVAKALALLGGLVLVAVMLLVVVSITGRALIPFGLGPVPGDFELVEAGTAFAIFAFLPWCQYSRGHVAVDILVPIIGKRRDAVLYVDHNLMMTAVAAFITWRLWAGMLDKMTYNETTFILRLPVWWGYAICVPLAVAFTLVAAFTVVRSWREAFRDPETARAP
ncbi:TRAP transporter small permease [Tepidamorphus sp. 3E244]|uniref:TRAP transporter small permease n=1 Tax=Tepidamorphus sp. 3E244 TaxID=3385498 RepID=UPI0038FCDE99